MNKIFTLLLCLHFLCSGQVPSQDESARQAGNTQGADADLVSELAGRAAMPLEDFEKLALAGNPTLREANALVNESAGQARQAGLYPNPSVGYQGEQIRGGAYQGGEQGAFVQQTIVLGGKLGLRRNIYEEQRRANEIGVSEQRFRVASDVSQSFYAALAAQETVTLRKQLLALSLDALTTAHQLANVGQADAPDVLQAEVETEQARMDYMAAQRFYIECFRKLSSSAGRPDIPLARLKGDLEKPPEIDGALVIDQIVKESPAVKRAQQEAVRARAELMSATREMVPDLQVRAGVQQNSEPLNEMGRRVGVQGFATVGIALPLFNRNQGNVAAAKAEMERSEAEVTRVQLSLRQSTQPFLQGYLLNRTRADGYKRQMIPRAERAYELYLAKYQSMGAAYAPVLISQRTLFQLREAYIAALEGVWKNAIGLQNFGFSSGLSPLQGSSASPSSMNLPVGEQ